ncbi:MAG: ABC transporter ATP-binding protein, partial [Clostridia bacterium]|nr:ABC transporter ATP-binding protein [Clostridia bacterium]
MAFDEEGQGRFIFVIVCILISAGAGVVSSMFIRILIDRFITPMIKTKSTDFSGLAGAMAVIGVILVTGAVATLLYNRIMVTISQGIQKKIRDEMFSHMQKLPIKFFDTNTHGDLMSRYTNDTDTLRQMLSMSIPQMFSSLITIVSVFVAMLVLNVWMTLFVLLFVGIMMFITKSIAGKSATYFIRQQKQLGDVNGYIEEMINGQKVIKVFCHEEKAKEIFDKKNEELCDSSTNANTFVNILMPIMNNLGNIQYVLIAVVGAALAIYGISPVTLGTIASFLQLSKNFTRPIGEISNQFNSIIMALAGAERIFKLMDEEPEKDEGYVTLVNAKYDKENNLVETDERTEMWAWKHPHGDGTVTYTKLCGNVVMDDVDFGYVPEKIVLHNVTLDAKSGQKIAFVGATGAGKTTITNLINRFYDIDDGKIRYDGININKIKKADLRKSLGIVLQDVHLFTGTVMDNIRYGKLDATDEECIAAAKLANAHNFIERLPDGYNTVITGDGGQLSQGQCQLISIARAAVADPPVMILDEATSSIDTRTEALVQKGMDGLMYGRTVFVIAHRLSTVQNSDLIMVLELGKVIEKGTHDELIAQKG